MIGAKYFKKHFSILFYMTWLFMVIILISWVMRMSCDGLNYISQAVECHWLPLFEYLAFEFSEMDSWRKDHRKRRTLLYNMCVCFSDIENDLPWNCRALFRVTLTQKNKRDLHGAMSRQTTRSTRLRYKVVVVPTAIIANPNDNNTNVTQCIYYIIIQVLIHILL